MINKHHIFDDLSWLEECPTMSFGEALCDDETLEDRNDKEEKMKAIDVANIFVELSNDDEQGSLTNMAVNKLVYLAQGWSLALLDKPLFEDDIYAWRYGPVEKDVYYAFKPCGKDIIEETTANVSSDEFDSDEIDLIMDVYNNYKKYSAIGLMELSHDSKGPWKQYYNPQENVLIPKEAIKEYFKTLEPIKRFSDTPIPEELIIDSRNNEGYLILPNDYE